MSFRLHSMIAMLGAILLLATLMTAQDASPATQQQQNQAVPSQTQTPEEPPPPVLTGPYPPMSKAAEERARQVFQMFNTGNTSAEWSTLIEGLRKRAGSEAKLAEANKRLRDRIGVETEMLAENMVPNYVHPGTIYSRLSTFSKVNISVMCMVAVNPRGEVETFSIGPMQPVAEGRNSGHKDATKLKLPFQGEWLVTQGGRTAFDNGYAASDEMRFGVDFALLKNGSPFSGIGGVGSKNQDYYCFGQPILAPADGTVVKAEAGYDDNQPGRPTGDQADGNLVVISHGNSESSLINHLKQNSLRVKRGDKVTQGEVIAECGNSGSSPFPHLHYQLQRTTNELYPAQFVDYVANGKPVAVGEPKKGQFVKNGTTPSEATPAKQ